MDVATMVSRSHVSRAETSSTVKNVGVLRCAPVAGAITLCCIVCIDLVQTQHATDGPYDWALALSSHLLGQWTRFQLCCAIRSMAF